MGVPAAGRRIGGLTSNGVCSQAATRQLTEKKTILFFPILLRSRNLERPISANGQSRPPFTFCQFSEIPIVFSASAVFIQFDAFILLLPTELMYEPFKDHKCEYWSAVLRLVPTQKRYPRDEIARYKDELRIRV